MIQRQLQSASLHLAMRSLKPGSVDQYASGIRCWGAFSDLFDTAHFPVKASFLVWYLNIFRVPSTALQYLKHLKWWSKMGSHRWPEERFVQLAIAGLEKERRVTPKKAPTIGWSLTRRLMQVAVQRRDAACAAIYGLCSSFLFRAIDECLPLEWNGRHSQIHFAASRRGRKSVFIDLASRKNAQFGARLERICISHSSDFCSELLCPYHILYHCRRLSQGPGRLFDISATQFSRSLKNDLASLGVENASTYTPHGFRRGSAQEMHSRGASLAAILVAGGWRSAAFLTYLQHERIDADRLMECLCLEDED